MANIDTDIPQTVSSPTPRPRTSNSDGTVSPSQRRSAFFANANQSPAELKKKLQEQLTEKANKIQATAEYGNALVQQKEQIEQRIRELEETQGDVISPELQHRLAQLEKEAMSLDTDTRKVFMTATSQGTKDSPSANSPSNSPIPSSPLEQATTPEAPLSRSANRRLKSQTRHNDVEFAAEIGQNLLKEVKRLHALVQEKEEMIKELESEKAELERIIESLNKQLRLREDAEESLKSQVWELEVRVQSLDQERESQTVEVSRLRKEIQLQEKKLGQSTDLLEQVKAREAKLNTELADSKTKYERQVRAQKKAFNDLKKENQVISKALDEARQDNLNLKTKLKRKDEISPPPAKGLLPLMNVPPEAVDDAELDPETASSIMEKYMMTLNHVDPQVAEAVKQMFDELKVLQVKNGSLQSENEEIKNMLADREEEIERLRSENGFGVIQGQKKRKELHKKKSSSLSQNSLAGISEDAPDATHEDDYDGQSEIFSEEDDMDNINRKNNRPDSNMFKPRLQPRESRISSTRLRNSTQPEDESEDEELIDVGEMITEPIVNRGLDETLEAPVHQDPEAVEAARAETLEALTKQKPPSKRASKKILVDEPGIIPGTEDGEVTASPRNSKSRGSVVQERISKYETIAQASKRLSSATGTKGEYDDDDIENDASSVESYASARQSGASKIEENIDGSVIGQDSTAERGDSKASDNRDSRISQRASKASKHGGSRGGDEDEVNIDSIGATKGSKRASAVSPSNRHSAVGVVSDDTYVRTEISFMEIGVQTILSTVEVGIQTDAPFELKTTEENKGLVAGEGVVNEIHRSGSLSADFGNNNLAENRFTLDLAANATAKAKAQNSKNTSPQSLIPGELQNISRQNSTSRPITPPPRPINGPPQNLLITVQNAQNMPVPVQPPVSIENGQQNRSNIVAIAKGKQKEDPNVQRQQVATAANSHHQHTGSLDSVSTGSTVSSSASSSNYRGVKRNSNSSQNGEEIQSSLGKSRFDQAVLQAVTQTMIGETLHKYTRRNFGVERRHARYFWVHPYSSTLYWSAKDPNSSEMSDPRSRTPMLATQAAYIQSVQQVPDSNPPHLYHMSIIVKTPNPKHEIKFTAPTKEIHETWFKALTFLTEQIGTDSLGNQTNSRQIQQGSGSPNGTLRPSNLPTQDLKKKSSFSKLTALMRRDASSSLTRGLSSPLQHEQENLSMFDDDFENVRECCDGRHNVNDLAKGRRN